MFWHTPWAKIFSFPQTFLCREVGKQNEFLFSTAHKSRQIKRTKQNTYPPSLVFFQSVQFQREQSSRSLMQRKKKSPPEVISWVSWGVEPVSISSKSDFSERSHKAYGGAGGQERRRIIEYRMNGKSFFEIWKRFWTRTTTRRVEIYLFFPLPHALENSWMRL